MGKYKMLKYIILGSCVKLSSTLLQADSNLKNKIDFENPIKYDSEKQIEYYDTTKLKRDILFYDKCKEE